MKQLFLLIACLWAQAAVAQTSAFRLERSAVDRNNIAIEAQGQTCREIGDALQKGGFLDFDGVVCFAPNSAELVGLPRFALIETCLCYGASRRLST
jgi:hypothetical protein